MLCAEGTFILYNYFSFIYSKFKPSRIFIHPTAQTKFNQEFGIMKDEWKNIYYLPYRCSMEVSMRIVQYKINMDCLMTNVKLSKIKIINSDACSFCSKFPETMKHLFFYCKYTQPIWKQFENWWKGLSQEETTLNFKSILFGQNTDQPDLLLNLCILLTQKMISEAGLINRGLTFILLLI